MSPVLDSLCDEGGESRHLWVKFMQWKVTK